MKLKRDFLTISIAGLLAFSLLSISLAPVAAAQTSSGVEMNQAGTTDSATCEGSPTMARNSITSPRNVITEETAGLIEANFRVSENTPAECTVVVDVQFSFAQSGFQFEGGSVWDQSATDIVATQFTLGSGDIRSIDAEVAANGATVGDELTVVADYEIWYEGDRQNSRQISGVRQEFEVQEPGAVTDTSSSDSTPVPTEPPEPGILDAIADNIVAVIAVAGIGLVGLVLAWKGSDIIAISS